MRSIPGGDSGFYLFSASLGCLGVLGDKPFLGARNASSQCAETPMKVLIAEDAEVAEARREKQSRPRPYFVTSAPWVASSAFRARAGLRETATAKKNPVVVAGQRRPIYPGPQRHHSGAGNVRIDVIDPVKSSSGTDQDVVSPGKTIRRPTMD